MSEGKWGFQMIRAAAVKTGNVKPASGVSNECAAGSERFEPVSRLLKRFEQETEKMLRKAKAA